MAGIGCFVVPGGLQTVLYPWLIAVQLDETPERLGMAQTALMLPGLVLVLFAGLLADRSDCRKILMLVHLALALPVAALAIMIHFGQLSYEVMLIYAIIAGSIGIFAQPARDSLLNRIAGEQIQRTVTITMGLTFGAQIVGFILASQAANLGPQFLLAIQFLVLLSGGYCAWNLDPAPVTSNQRFKERGQIRAGLALVIGSERMGPAIMLALSMGVFFGGAFIVTLPLMVRDVYHGSSVQMAYLFTAFMLGTVSMTTLMVRFGGIHYQGRAIIVTFVSGSLALSVTSFSPPFPLFLLAVFFWGMSGAVVMTLTRSILQFSAPASHRARVLSVFSLANLGGMPMGALTLGYVAGAVGPANTILVSVFGVLIATVSISALTGFHRLESEERRIT